MTRSMLRVIYALALSIPAWAAAQPCAPTWSDEFAAGEVDGLVRCAVPADLDGEGGQEERLFIGGGFTRAGGLLAPRIVAFDGRQWHTLGTGLPEMNTIYAAAAFDDGSGMKVYVGGEVAAPYGYRTGGVYSWDGESWNQVGPDFPGLILALASFDDGAGPALYAGGLFVYQDPAPGLSRWNTTEWEPVGGGLSGSPFQNPGVYSLRVWKDAGGEALFVGGAFTQAGEIEANGIARWSGESWSALGAGVAGKGGAIVLAMTPWDDGSGESLHVTGRFETTGGVVAINTARWDGGTWEATGLGLGDQSDFVNALAPFDDGAGPVLFGGGPFMPVNGNPESGYLAYWDGLSWTEAQGFYGSYQTGPRVLTPYAGASPPSLYVGGDFRNSYMPAAYLLRLRPGARWEQVGNGINPDPNDDGAVHALSAWNNREGARLFVGGEFQYAGGVSDDDELWDRGAAVWDGLDWRVNANDQAWFYSLNAFSVFDDGGGPALFAGARLISGVSEQGYVALARWTQDRWLEVAGAPDPGNGKHVACLAVDPGVAWGGSLFVGGLFPSAGGKTCNSIARFDGKEWFALDQGIAGGDAVVNALSFFATPGSEGLPVLVAGGSFTAAGGAPASNIAAWDGQEWTALASGLNAPVRALCVFDDGAGPALYAGGDTGGQPAAHLARWNGQSWSPVGEGTDGPVLALAVFDDGSGPALYIGGNFTHAGGQPASNLVRFDGAAWSAAGLEADGPVRALLPAWEDGRGVLWVGGSFLSVAGISSGRIARLDGCACYADFDGSGALDIADFLLFQSLFAIPDSRADCDASGALDLFDFLCFVNLFNSGC